MKIYSSKLGFFTNYRTRGCREMSVSRLQLPASLVRERLIENLKNWRNY